MNGFKVCCTRVTTRPFVHAFLFLITTIFLYSCPSCSPQADAFAAIADMQEKHDGFRKLAVPAGLRPAATAAHSRVCLLGARYERRPSRRRAMASLAVVFAVTIAATASCFFFCYCHISSTLPHVGRPRTQRERTRGVSQRDAGRSARPPRPDCSLNPFPGGAGNKQRLLNAFFPRTIVTSNCPKQRSWSWWRS